MVFINLVDILDDILRIKSNTLIFDQNSQHNAFIDNNCVTGYKFVYTLHTHTHTYVGTYTQIYFGLVTINKMTDGNIKSIQRTKALYIKCLYWNTYGAVLDCSKDKILYVRYI